VTVDDEPDAPPTDEGASIDGASDDEVAQDEGASNDEVAHDDGASDDEVAHRSARWPLLLGVGAATLAIDQVTKAWAVAELGDGRAIDLVGSLRLRLVLNYGAAFSLTDGRGPLISILALVVVALLLRTGRHATRPAMAVSLGLIVGGALGNLVDRAFREGDGLLGGGVIDFVDLQWWPVFNVADSAIVVGAILLFVLQWREPDPEADAGRRR
jgi:signal peptidase II